MRRAAVILVLTAAGALPAGCGKSAHFGGTSSSGHPAVAATSSGRLLSRAQARKLAPLLNLQASDLPGFKASSERASETGGSKGLERNLIRCMGGHATSAALAEASSKTFERQLHLFQVNVGSSVTIAKTPAQAASELASIRSAHTRTCLTRFVAKLLQSELHGGANVKLVAISKGSPSKSGTAGTFAWRISELLTLHGVRLPFYIELVGFVYGQDEVELFSFSLPAPFPAPDEQALFSLLVERAKAGGSAKRGKHGGTPTTPSQSGPRQVQISL